MTHLAQKSPPFQVSSIFLLTCSISIRHQKLCWMLQWIRKHNCGPQEAFNLTVFYTDFSFLRLGLLGWLLWSLFPNSCAAEVHKHALGLVERCLGMAVAMCWAEGGLLTLAGSGTEPSLHSRPCSHKDVPRICWDLGHRDEELKVSFQGWVIASALITTLPLSHYLLLQVTVPLSSRAENSCPVLAHTVIYL